MPLVPVKKPYGYIKNLALNRSFHYTVRLRLDCYGHTRTRGSSGVDACAPHAVGGAIVTFTIL